MKLIYFTVQVVFIALMVGVAGLFLLPLLPLDNNIQLRIVESGSMEPNIMTGSLVVIAPASAYGVGDVVTFKSATADVPTTHRIIESFSEGGRNYFVTKGDANEEADTASVPVEDVLGKIAVDVPYAGFILDFARQPIGFSLLILLPAFMIILSEIEKIWVEIRNRRKVTAREVDDEDEDEDGIEPDDGGLTDRLTTTVSRGVRMMDIGTPVQYRILPTLDLRNRQPIQQNSPAFSSGHRNNLSQWATICLVIVGSSIFVTASFLPYTASYFNDIERTVDNVLGATMLDFRVQSQLNSFNFLGTNLDTENSSVVNVVEPVKGSADARYNLRVEFKGGNPLFCDAIVANMSVLPTIYAGPLLLLSASNVDFSGLWSLGLTIDENVTGYLPGDLCQVDIVYTAWHQDEDSDTGYHDEERVLLTFYAPVAQIPFARTAPSTELFILSTESVVEEEVPDNVIDSGGEEPLPEESTQPLDSEEDIAEEIVEVEETEVEIIEDTEEVEETVEEEVAEEESEPVEQIVEEIIL